MQKKGSVFDTNCERNKWNTTSFLPCTWLHQNQIFFRHHNVKLQQSKVLPFRHKKQPTSEQCNTVTYVFTHKSAKLPKTKTSQDVCASVKAKGEQLTGLDALQKVCPFIWGLVRVPLGKSPFPRYKVFFEYIQYIYISYSKLCCNIKYLYDIYIYAVYAYTGMMPQ